MAVDRPVGLVGEVGFLTEGVETVDRPECWGLRGWIAGIPNERLGTGVLLVVRGVDFEVLLGEALATAAVDLTAAVWESVWVE